MLTGPQKARVGTIIGLLGVILTALVVNIPDGTTAKGVIVAAGAVVTAIGTYLGIYNTTNKPAPNTPVRRR